MQAASQVFWVSLKSGSKSGGEIILDFVTDNKYYFTGNNLLGAAGS